MSPRRNWDSPTPSLASECAPPPGTKGGAHSPAGEGLGESQFRRLEKKLSTLPYPVLNSFYFLKLVTPSRFCPESGLISQTNLIRVQQFYFCMELTIFFNKKIRVKSLFSLSIFISYSADCLIKLMCKPQVMFTVRLSLLNSVH
jgi:hypothetical protein